MGILHRDFTAKPAYWTYSTLTRVLSGLDFAGKLEIGNSAVLGYRFARGAKSVVALWSVESSQSITLPVTGNRISLVNAIGESRTISPGSVRIDLSEGTPVYLLVE